MADTHQEAKLWKSRAPFNVAYCRRAAADGVTASHVATTSTAPYLSPSIDGPRSKGLDGSSPVFIATEASTVDTSTSTPTGIDRGES